MIKILLLIFIAGCASPNYCNNKVGIEKEQCDNKRQRWENDWRYERRNRFDRG